MAIVAVVVKDILYQDSCMKSIAWKWKTTHKTKPGEQIKEEQARWEKHMKKLKHKDWNNIQKEED